MVVRYRVNADVKTATEYKRLAGPISHLKKSLKLLKGLINTSRGSKVYELG